MARLTARIKRLEALDQVKARDELRNLSGDELDARICQVAERLTGQLRDEGMSVAECEAGVWPPDAGKSDSGVAC